jgi:hypothetical protein
MTETICYGSLMDGLSIDLIEYSEISTLSESEEDLLWSENTDISIINQSSRAELVVTGEFDEIPGQSDEFYEVETDDPISFKAELRQIISNIIGR